jgi:predicted nucleic acid-binding Zn ribbon protein
MPLANRQELPNRRQAYQAAVQTYRDRLQRRGVIPFRRCPKCGHGTELGRRLCTPCAQENRKESKRQAWRRAQTRHLSQNATLLANNLEKPKTQGGMLVADTPNAPGKDQK